MSTIELLVPTVNDFDASDFDRLFGLWSDCQGAGRDVTLNFSRCSFLRQNAVAFLGGLIRLVEHRGGRARVDWSTLRPDVGRNLAKNGFRDIFGERTDHGLGETIPYREDREADKEALMDYLKNLWLGREWVSVSSALRDAIVGVVYEIYANAFEHAESPIGLFSCGQHFWNRKELRLTVVDFGIGIPANVRRFASNDTLSADKTMEWAFMAGTTTKPNGMGRGMGLDLLREFVRAYPNRRALPIAPGHDGVPRGTRDDAKEDRERGAVPGQVADSR